jgi:CubicO group peptidase (beta-lactamase class C family)
MSGHSAPLPDLARVDDVFDRFFAGRAAPGVSYGVVVDGRLAHARGLGTMRIDAQQLPAANSVFRIASMTKSFTAASILLLRDEGRLRLDDAVATWVPELAGHRGPTADSPALTIEHLLTMSAGFPTDDPWADRQQDLPFDRFARLLRDGVSVAWPPGTTFEYSNLGYAVLGLVVTRAGTMEYREFVDRRLLAPLGMTSTTYLPADVPADRLAPGYVLRDDAWLAEPIDDYGAFAAMGGLFTSVADLARWVAGLVAAFPPRDGADDHPLSRASRREMQQVQRSFAPEVRRRSADAPPTLLSGGYGYGLVALDDLRLGRVVEHGGGYPGYGSHMRWHPSSGVGIVAMANGRYARMVDPVREALDALLEVDSGRTRHVVPWRQTTDARRAVEGLLGSWDDEVADALFAMNVELDEPLSRRRDAFERLRASHGQLRSDPSEAPVSDSPAHLGWWLTGERGRVHVEILLSPERPPRVQKVSVTSVPEPPTALEDIARRVVDLLGQPSPAWPADLELDQSVERPALDRTLRAAEALYGPVTLGRATTGDGERQATWRLSGAGGDLDLTVCVEPDTGHVSEVTVVPRLVIPPTHAV